MILFCSLELLFQGWYVGLCGLEPPFEGGKGGNQSIRTCDTREIEPESLLSREFHNLMIDHCTPTRRLDETHLRIEIVLESIMPIEMIWAEIGEDSVV